MNESKNLYWINALKGICMIAVFYVHCMLLCGPWIHFASPEIHAFYVNGFFLISGYLLFWKQLTTPRIEETRRKYVVGGGKLLILNIIFRIVIPSILFAILFYFPAKIVKNEEISALDFFMETFGGRTFWFTSALAVAEMVIFCLLLTRKKSIWFYTACLSIIVAIGFFFSSINPETYALDFWAWRRGLLSLAYLCFGGLYWRFEKWVDKYLLNWYSFIGLFVIMELLIRCIGNEDYLLVSMLTLTPLGIIPGVISVLLLIKLCKIIPYSKFLTFIGQNSIGFFFLCSGIPLLLGVVSHKLFEIESVFILLIVFVLSITISYGIVYIINHVAPWVFDLRKLKKCRE